MKHRMALQEYYSRNPGDAVRWGHAFEAHWLMVRSRLSIIGSYAVVATLWILFSDAALGVLVHDPTLRLEIGSMKGIGFVVVTALLLGWLMSRRDDALRRTMSALVTSEESRGREVATRAAVSASLARLPAAASHDAAAAVICEELVRLPDIDIAEVLVFASDGGLRPAAVSVPGGAEVQLAEVPPGRAGYLRERAGRGPWVESWHPGPADGLVAETLSQAGLRSMGYWPVGNAGDPRAILAIGTTGEAQAATVAERLVSVAQFADLANAILGPQLESEYEEATGRELLADIITNRRVRTVFQPICQLRSGRVIGFEALSRFDDGADPAGRFELAARLGLGQALEEVAVRVALESARQLPAGPWLSVNVSPSFVESPAVEWLWRPPRGRSLVVEITEHAIVEDYERVRRRIRRGSKQLRLAIDDAGAGYASLRHIVELRPAYVKVDRALVAGLDTDPVRAAVVAGIGYFAKRIECGVIAEGVETEAERDELRRLRVGLGQGYLLGKPAAAASWASSAGSSLPVEQAAHA